MAQAFAVASAMAVGGLYYAFGRTHGAGIVRAFSMALWFAFGTATVIILF